MKNYYKNFRNVLLLAAALLCSMQMFAQQSIIPAGNPKVIRLQGATFSVTLVNDDPAALTGLTLESSASTGFTVSPTSITGINLAGSGGSDVQTFTVTADCNAPQEGGLITYTLKDGATVLKTADSYAITIDEPDFIFSPPADREVDFVSDSITYTRTWAIQQTAANVSVNNLRIVNTCNKTVLNITKLELMTGMSGTVIADVTTTVLNNTPSTGYHYNIGASVFAQIGNSDGKFDAGETVYIRETYQVIACGTGTSTYTFGHGDGTDFCFEDQSYTATTTVVQPSYTPDINTTRAITYPLTSTGTGTMCFTISNNSPHAKAVFFDTKVRVWCTDLNLYFFTRAYLVDAAGVPLPGFPDLIMTNNTAIVNSNGTNAIGGNAMTWVVSFANLNNPANATAYEAAGLYDITGNGIWNDMLPGATCYIAVDWMFDPSLATPCATTFCPSSTRRADLYYKNTCGTYQSYTRQYGSGTNVYVGILRYGTPLSIIMAPENLKANDPAELRINEQNYQGSNNSGWTINQNNYEQYIIVTLPEGFDYDDTQQGFRINAVAMCALADVTRTVVSGRVVLTVRNRVVNATSDNQYYRINIFAMNSITSSDLKAITIEHEWAYQGETHCKYGCYTDIPVNYRLIEPFQNMTLEKFNVQRMTFGWTNYLKTTRIDLTNISSYPGVDRNVAGPYDNVDMTGEITINSGFSINHATDKWLVDVSYDGATANEYFIFPDSAQAVAVSLNGGTPFYIPETDITTLSTTISGGKNYIMRVDLTDYTLTGQPLETLTDGDTVSVTFKTQTVEALPTTLTQIKNFAMQTYLDVSNAGAPADKNILAKNFSLVDYKWTPLRTTNNAAVFYENIIGNDWMQASSIYCSPGINPSEVFPNEFRPNEFITYYECTFNTLIDITNARTIEYFIGEGVSNIITNLTSGDYTVTHANGKTTLVITKELQIEMVSGTFFNWQVQGKYYCATNTTVSAKASLNLYPSSERTDIMYESTVTNLELYSGGKHLYTYNLSVTSPEIYPTTNHAEWDFTLTNQSYWAGTDGILPNSWMSVTLPPEVQASSIALTDGSSTWIFSDFLSYGSGKYWVKLGDLNINSFEDFNLSCTYTSCVPFTVDLSYGMSRAGYPIDPETGFAGGDGTPCGSYKYLTFNAVPPLYSLRGEVESPAPDGTGDPTRYLFCTPHTFKAIFYNTQEGALDNPVLRLTLGVGVELSNVLAMQNGSPVAIDTITGDTGNTNTERLVYISLAPGTVLQPYGNAGDQIEISFDLKPVCGYTSGAVVHMRFLADNACGTTIGESKNSVPIHIDGASVDSDYSIDDFMVTSLGLTGTLDLSSASAMATSGLNLVGKITLLTPSQSIDYIAISAPPNMNISSSLSFIFHKVENGNNIYKTDMPVLTMGGYCEVDVTLTPVNPEEWSCEDITVAMYTYIEIPMSCDLKTCDIDVKHANEQTAQVPVIKTDLAFLAGSITATGSYYDTTHEQVTFDGTLEVPFDTYLEDLLIEVFTDAGGTLQAVTGNPTFTVPLVATDSVTDAFAFSSGAPLVIPTADMCNLWLVIRRSSAANHYICDSIVVQVQSPGFILTDTLYSTCPNGDVEVGDAIAITGYTYTWTPTTYIVGSNVGTPITAKFPSSLIGDQTLNLTVTRGGCATATTATVTFAVQLLSPPSATTPQTFCSGATIANLQARGTGIVWYNAANTLMNDSDPITNGIYYAAQTTSIGCEGERTAVTVIIDTIITDAPNVPGEVTLCSPATLADIPTNGNTNIVWYDAAVDGSVVPTTTNLNNGDIYYATLTGGGTCESIQRKEVNIVINSTTPDAPTMRNPQHLCDGAIVANLTTPNNQILWYDAGNNLLPNDTKLETGTYFAIQKAGGCLSALSDTVNVLIDQYPPPIAPTTQTTCGGKIIHVSDLTITGAGIQWYDENHVPITDPTTETVTDGKTYYATQSTGMCESNSIAILVTDDCYSPYGTIFPFIQTGDPSFDARFITTVSLYTAPPTAVLDKLGYIRRQTPIHRITASLYDCTLDTIAGAPKYPGSVGRTDNPGLPIRWDVIGITNSGIPNTDTLTYTDNCIADTVSIGKYKFENIAPGRYVIEIARQGFLTRYAEITVTGNNYLGHRELLGGDINGDMMINEKDLSAIQSKTNTGYGSGGYNHVYDFDGNKSINSDDVNIIRLNLNAYPTIYQETEDWVN